MKSMLQCMFTPRLYRIYREGARLKKYEPNAFEKWTDRLLKSAEAIMTITLYTSPFICMYIYKRGFFSIDEARVLTQILGGVGCLLLCSFIMRGYGRASNPKYVTFVNDLNSVLDHGMDLDAIRQYDFDFRAWPVNYSMPPKRSLSWLRNPISRSSNPDLPCYQRIPLQLLSFMATHTFALGLIYPGSLSIVQKVMWSSIFEGRTHLVEVYDGKRAKVCTSDGNHIDTMFVDRRRQHSLFGQTLVICSEGNSGFYEIGIMLTPIRAKYSTLGWNHPGFAESTGRPFPSQVQNAIVAVMEYAINKLDFQPENIVMFGWSIGGYAATWASLRYPIKGLILDATFDDLLPMAETHMPRSWSLLVREVVRSYVDLNIASLLEQYDGPVELVRRTQDEIITLRPGVMSTNRGNDLLMRLLEKRHPEVFEYTGDESLIPMLQKFIALPAHQRAVLETTNISVENRRLLRLIQYYLKDHNSTHCTPLPEGLFFQLVNNLSTTGYRSVITF